MKIVCLFLTTVPGNELVLLETIFLHQQPQSLKLSKLPVAHSNIQDRREGGGVGGVGSPEPAKVYFNKKLIDHQGPVQ